MTEIEKKTGMTDAECERLDKYYTENTFTPGPNLLKQGIKPGFAWKTLLLSELDQDVAEYLRSRAAATHKSQTELINDLVHEKLAVGV
ncbi:hypothetical protein FACS1894164_19620 [Spirochaetia bacterium]|nr:hypothetical protein FACS1894164_19620 [Spirochaetia bacterium]